MTLGRWSAVLIVAVVGAVVPMASATPPDPTWIAGLYDNADYDDVILFITGGLGAVQPTLAWSPCVVALVVRLAPASDTPVPDLAPDASGPSRAPPLA